MTEDLRGPVDPDPSRADTGISALRPVMGAIEKSGLVAPTDRVIALVSGGPDSACLVAALSIWLEPGNLVALHVNYGLRDESDEDAAVASRLCEGLGVDLATISADAADAADEGRDGVESRGNVQDWARRLRYDAAEKLRVEAGADWVATGHTATDVAETLIYRLASSPGSRALPGMRPRNGYVVRPIIDLERAETRRAAEEAGLEFADDRSNVDPKFARARIRAEILPVMEELNPAAVRNVVTTQAELVEEQALLQRLAAENMALARVADNCLSVEVLEESPPVLRRLTLRAFAESALGVAVPVSIGKAAEVWRLATTSEGGSVDLVGGASLMAEAGLIRIVPGDEPGGGPAEVTVPVPGSSPWGEWTVRAEKIEAPFVPLGPEVATLDAGKVGGSLTVRSWQEGDRIEPLGLDGSKSLQDLFTDRGVPRSLRRKIPVVLAGDEIAWVAGVEIGRRFRLTAKTTDAVRLSAVQLPRSP